MISKTPKRINYDSSSGHRYAQMWTGAEFYTFRADFDGIDKTLWGKESDSFELKMISIPEALSFFKKHAANMKQQGDVFNYEKALFVVEMLMKIK